MIRLARALVLAGLLVAVWAASAWWHQTPPPAPSAATTCVVGQGGVYVAHSRGDACLHPGSVTSLLLGLHLSPTRPTP